MTKPRGRRLRVALVVAALGTGALLGGAAITQANADADDIPASANMAVQDDGAAQAAADAVVDQRGAEDISIQARTADQAIAWYRARNGSRAYEGYCERAARLSWARHTRHATANAHWFSNSDGRRYTRGTPPKGAFVFWNIGRYGHVGIADGRGGFWATGVRGKIGHKSSVSYYSRYRGWKYGNSN